MDTFSKHIVFCKSGNLTFWKNEHICANVFEDRITQWETRTKATSEKMQSNHNKKTDKLKVHIENRNN